MLVPILQLDNSFMYYGIVYKNCQQWLKWGRLQEHTASFQSLRPWYGHMDLKIDAF